MIYHPMTYFIENIEESTLSLLIFLDYHFNESIYLEEFLDFIAKTIDKQELKFISRKRIKNCSCTIF